MPFCGERFLGSNYMGFVFVCTDEGELVEKGIYDAKEPRWIQFAESKRVVQNQQERIYSYHLSTLKYYVEQKEKGLI